MRVGVLTLDIEDYLLRCMPIKRDILFFDKILIHEPLFNAMLAVAETMVKIKNIPQIEVSYTYNTVLLYELHKRGQLMFADFDKVNIENIQKVTLANGLENIRELLVDNDNCRSFLSKTLDSNFRINEHYDLADLLNNLNEASNTSTRLFCLSKLANNEYNYIPILNRFNDYNKKIHFDKHYVFKYVLKEIPQPKDNISLEQLLDFKEDNDTKEKYFKLIGWINSVSKKAITIEEFEDEYQELYQSYLKQFKIHNIEYNLSIIEVLINGFAELFENTFTLKFSKITKGMFDIFKEDVKAEKSELGIKDRELAYIIKAQKEYGIFR